MSSGSSTARVQELLQRSRVQQQLALQGQEARIVHSTAFRVEARTAGSQIQERSYLAAATSSKSSAITVKTSALPKTSLLPSASQAQSSPSRQNRGTEFHVSQDRSLVTGNVHSQSSAGYKSAAVNILESGNSPTARALGASERIRELYSQNAAEKHARQPTNQEDKGSSARRLKSSDV